MSRVDDFQQRVADAMAKSAKAREVPDQEAILTEAVDAFWAEYAEQVPEVVSGDSRITTEDLGALHLLVTGVDGPYSPVDHGGVSPDWIEDERVDAVVETALAAAEKVLRDAEMPISDVTEIRTEVVRRLKHCVEHVLYYNPPPALASPPDEDNDDEIEDESDIGNPNRVALAQRAIMNHAKALGIENDEATLAYELCMSLREFCDSSNIDTNAFARAFAPADRPQDVRKQPEDLELFSVTLNWASDDDEQGSYTTTVWASNADAAISLVAVEMADLSEGRRLSDEARAEFITERIEGATLGAAVLVKDVIDCHLKALLADRPEALARIQAIIGSEVGEQVQSIGGVKGTTRARMRP